MVKSIKWMSEQQSDYFMGNKFIGHPVNDTVDGQTEYDVVCHGLSVGPVNS